MDGGITPTLHKKTNTLEVEMVAMEAEVVLVAGTSVALVDLVDQEE